jgi:hypothetical protein
MVVERLQIDLVIQEDGAVHVTETVTARTVGRPEEFERELTTRGDSVRVDRFEAVDASIVAEDSSAPGEVLIEMRPNGDVHVRWPEAPADVARTCRLDYRAEGALEVIGTRAWLRWRLTPLMPSYPIADVAVTLQVPAGMRFAEPPAIAGEGWTLTERPGGVRATQGAQAPGQEARLTAVMDIGALTLLEPQWQQNADRAREMAPAFLSGALCILVVGVGAIIMVRVQYMKSRATSALMSARDAGRGLVVTGVVVLVLGAATAAGVPFAIERYGPSIATIPASLILVCVLMLVAGIRLGRWHIDIR